MTNREDIKFKMLAANPADIYVMTHQKADGGIEYAVINEFGMFKATSFYDNWLEATWFESAEEVEGQIADTVRNLYSVECIRISREPLERGVTITKEPPKAQFKCTCGCEFSANPITCNAPHSTLEGETSAYSTVAFWLKCPVCGHECRELRIR